MYFAGDPLNDVDRLLLAIPEGERPKLVVAFSAATKGAPPTGVFDIVLKRV
jgi:hypothetical protein